MNVDTEPGVYDALIPLGESESNEVDFEGNLWGRIDMPAGWNTANITVLGRYNGGELRPIYTETAEYVIASAAAGRAILINPGVASGLTHVVIRSGTAAVPVAQEADRLLKLVISAA